MSEGAKALAEQLGFDVAADAAGRQIDAAVAPLVSLLRSRLGHSEDWWTNEPMMNREWRRGAERALEQWRTGR